MQRTRAMTRRKAGPGSRRPHRLMDEVYREMYRLEAGRPGAEMGLALALLRAFNAADLLSEDCVDGDCLKTVSPICLKMIEDSLESSSAETDPPEGWPTSVPERRCNPFATSARGVRCGRQPA